MSLLRHYMRLKLENRYEELFRVFEDYDLALEWCENQLLAKRFPHDLPEHCVPLKDYELLANLSNENLAVVGARLKPRRFELGEVIVKAGDAARELFFLARGKVSVNLILSSGASKRLATFSAGMAFGEMALIDGAPRAADIVADTEVGRWRSGTGRSWKAPGRTRPNKASVAARA